MWLPHFFKNNNPFNRKKASYWQYKGFLLVLAKLEIKNAIKLYGPVYTGYLKTAKIV